MAWVDGYGTVVENVSPRVTSFSVIVQTFELATTSEMLACIWSPGATVMLTLSDGAGTSSYHAEYDAFPVESTSCSVPVWISVLSPAVQPESMQPPPIPIQFDDASACPAVCWVAVGTVQLPVLEWKSLPPCSSAPWL